MAGKARFRVPTLDEIDRANQQEELMPKRPLFSSSKATDSAPGEPDTMTHPTQKKGSPKKRVMSQKALLSRMPLGRQRAAELSKMSSPSKPLSSESSKVCSDLNRVSVSSPVKAPVSGSSDKLESAAVNKVSGFTGDPLVRHRVSHLSGGQSAQQGAMFASSAGPSSISQSQTSRWTGNSLGEDRRNAQQPPDRSLSSSTLTEPHKACVAPASIPLAAERSASAQQCVQAPQASSAGLHKDSSSVSLTSGLSFAGGGGGATEGGSGQQQDSVRADVLPTLAKLGKTNSLVVNSRQRGNPILKYVRNVPWEFGNIVPDYVMGQSNCALYLSLRYHQLHPDYIHSRLKQLGRSFDLRVMLVQVDIKDPHHLLKDLAKICILADCTLMVAFSAEEAGRYLETYKVYENKAAEAIMERTDASFTIQLSDCLTRVKSVNKTDCSTLLATFGTLQRIMEASTEELSLCPGFGPQKAKRLHDVFREPFLVSKKQRADKGDTKQ